MSFSNVCGCLNDAYYGPPLTNTCSGGGFALFMAIVDSLLRYNCKINDPCGRITPTLVPDDSYDFVVIGGGTAGSLVAGKLAEVYGWRILLIEAGGDEPPGAQVPAFAMDNFLGTEIDWQFKTEPEPVAFQGEFEHRASWNRGKVLGGTGVLNGMVYIKPTRKNMDPWVEAGNTNWTYDELLSVYKRIENNPYVGTNGFSSKYWGTDGPLTVQHFNYQPEFAFDILRAANQAGFPVSKDLDGDVFNGMGLIIANNRDGMRLSTSKAYLWPQKNNKNLHIMLNSTATKIIVEETNGIKKATFVEFVYNNQMFRVGVGKEVILTAGSIKTPQLLLLSGIGSKAILDPLGIDQVYELPAVGRGIKDHVGFGITMEIDQAADNLLNWYSLTEYLSSEGGVMSSPGLTQVGARLNSAYSSPDDPDLMFFWNGYKASCSYTGDPNASENPKDRNEKRQIEASVWTFQPLSKGYISLNTANPFDQPKIVANYLTVEQDIKVIISAIRKFQQWSKAPVLKEKYNLKLVKSNHGNCSEMFEYDTDAYWACAIKYSTEVAWHQACSCKMGLASDPEACVDQKLQLYGVENIRIADGSALPDLPTANPQAVIMAVAQRAVDFIREEYEK